MAGRGDGSSEYAECYYYYYEMRIGKAKFDLDDVVYCQGEGNYTRIFLRDGQILLSCYTLKYVNTLLKLLRVSKKHAVNQAYVLLFDQNTLLMKTNVFIPVSRSRATLVRLQLTPNRLP